MLPQQYCCVAKASYRRFMSIDPRCSWLLIVGFRGRIVGLAPNNSSPFDMRLFYCMQLLGSWITTGLPCLKTPQSSLGPLDWKNAKQTSHEGWAWWWLSSSSAQKSQVRIFLPHNISHFLTFEDVNISYNLCSSKYTYLYEHIYTHMCQWTYIYISMQLYTYEYRHVHLNKKRNICI